MKNIDVKTFVREWVKDLRSGKFKQTQSQLCKKVNGTPTYCCLGVACVTGKRLGLSKKAFDDATRQNGGSPNHKWFKELFDNISNPTIKLANGKLSDCMTANDNLGMSFDQIADGLERQYLS